MLRPIFYTVITGRDTYRFSSRIMARAFRRAAILLGHAAIVKAIL